MYSSKSILDTFEVEKASCLLTFASKFHFGASLSTLLLVPDKALVHSAVVFANRSDLEHASIVAGNRFAVLQPRDGLDRVSFVLAGEHCWSSEVYSLHNWFQGR